MFRLFFAFSIFVSCGAVSAQEFSIATFNTYWLYDDEEPHKRWADRREEQDYQEALGLVAEAIKTIDADVIALQEIEGPHVTADLVERLKADGVDYPHFWTGQGLDPFTGQDVAVLSKFPALTEPVLRYPSLTEEFHEDRGGYPRIAALQKFMRVDLGIHGHPVTVFAAHLKSQRGGESSEEERLAQARMVRRLARAVAEKGSSRSPNFVAIAGDLNDDAGTPTLLTLRGFTDGSYEFKQPSGRIAEADRWTHTYVPSSGPIEQEQLDHVIVNKFLDDRVTRVEIIRFENEVSDHDAFKVTFELNE
jgi:endonuclease/exonuclease/phosphatase family metal-dependent hydrolase